MPEIPRSVVVESKIDREIFQSRDGRWLGNEFRIDMWYVPFSGNYEDLPETKTILDTAAFHTKEEGQAWVEELRNRQAIQRVEDLYA